MVDFSTHNISLDGTHKQLIDLNKDKKLFSVEFTITPHTLDLSKTYQIAVVSQSVLDGDNPIEFKEVNGIYKGNAKHDDQQSSYENFFLILKSSKQMKEMQVEVELTEIPDLQEAPKMHADSRVVKQDEGLDNLHSEIEPYVPKQKPKKEKNNNFFKYIILAAVLVIGGFMLYYFWKKSQKENKTALPIQLSEQKFSYDYPANKIETNYTENIFNPFSSKKSKKSPSIASPGSTKSSISYRDKRSGKSDSGESFIFED